MFEISRALLADCVAELARIEAARKAVATEIRSFPTPFPACDVHFTRLSEERERLRRLATAMETFLASARQDEGPLLHPRDTVHTPDGGKRYQPEPAGA